MSARNRKSGFTLVEILIVVVILGILAAIVIPQFSSASEAAKASSLKSTLQTVRSQLELFQVQHGGAYPPAMVDGSGGLPTWRVMTTKHGIADGADFANGVNDSDITYATSDILNLGPYLQKFPANPFANGSATVTNHWFYNPDTGRIAAYVGNLTDDQIESLGLDDTDDFVTEAPSWMGDE